MQILVFTQGLDDVPGEAVHVDPPALDPGGLRLFHKVDQLRVVQLVDREIVLREVNNGDLTFRVKIRSGVSPAVRFLGVNARFRAWTPTGPTLEVFKLF
ncbi:hypothetical protein O1611_g9598 [Lasiodiplodia mahajangana]|uniref:Uncharacterized protein n=1 Tax=Lasiodiplodia mahajangana TaxID=1108764 RepID=A0ACC2J7H9_9PEZI|nr:hypothetical protein O1611_g9598 [Lasiodiplodia mahajangana]